MCNSWDELESLCNSCQKCELCKTRHNVVVGKGNHSARVMFVGEAPGQTEDEQGEPFVGVAGQLFSDMLLIMGLTRDEVYITNILKCRPPHNRDPHPSEQLACIDYLKSQLNLVKPELVVCLGRIAAMQLISSDYKITRQHGEFVKKDDYFITALYHPSALLRDESKRPETYPDLKKIKEFLK